ncbi:hypothetical protein LOK49_LG09G01614 [Camellia lanceoleosa]|uniref:Uncharacterized protein n=1 Tax=Camellia lanceoleosa TaxID=1840588 RepID=A0ACC0GKA1_9ERIC|nr:hypothetical protein LOK49_LG09G01614 [Camellia lanceoleosa]
MRRVSGENNILALSGEDHKRKRGALVSFLKPEALKEYVGKMDEDGSFFTKANHDVISGTRDAHEIVIRKKKNSGSIKTTSLSLTSLFALSD